MNKILSYAEACAKRDALSDFYKAQVDGFVDLINRYIIRNVRAGNVVNFTWKDVFSVHDELPCPSILDIIMERIQENWEVKPIVMEGPESTFGILTKYVPSTCKLMYLVGFSLTAK